jgi:hypothetical protein
MLVLYRPQAGSASRCLYYPPNHATQASILCPLACRPGPKAPLDASAGCRRTHLHVPVSRSCTSTMPCNAMPYILYTSVCVRRHLGGLHLPCLAAQIEPTCMHHPSACSNFLTDNESDHIISLAKPFLERSGVVDTATGGSEISEIRTRWAPAPPLPAAYCLPPAACRLPPAACRPEGFQVSSAS